MYIEVLSEQPPLPRFFTSKTFGTRYITIYACAKKGALLHSAMDLSPLIFTILEARKGGALTVLYRLIAGTSLAGLLYHPPVTVPNLTIYDQLEIISIHVTTVNPPPMQPTDTDSPTVSSSGDTIAGTSSTHLPSPTASPDALSPYGNCGYM